MSSSVLSGTAFAADDNQPKYGSRALVLAPSGDHVDDDAQPEYVDGGWVTVGSSDWGDKVTDNDDNAAGSWKFQDLKGTVTAVVDAPLYSDDGAKISGRTVAARSSWAVDGSKKNDRTNEQRFRVSAHEWISENDAEFHENHTMNKVKRTPFVNIKVDTNGRTTVHLKPGKNYDLYKSDGTLSNRKLAGGTDWFSDEYAEEPGELNNNETPTQYFRVSTDEWVRFGDGVALEFAPFL